MNKKGFTTLEAIASVFIITLVLFSSIIILIDNRVQASATNDRLIAYQVGQSIRDDITNNSTYDAIYAWLNDTQKVVNSTNCDDLNSAFSCDIFSYNVNNIDFVDLVEVTFYEPTLDDITYGVIRYNIVLTYRGTRTIELGGLIYE